MVIEGYGVIKGVVGFSKLARMSGQVAKLARAEMIVARNMTKSNSIWSSRKNMNPVENAFWHWKKHGKEFNELENARHYVEKVREFLSAPPSRHADKNSIKWRNSSLSSGN